MTELNPPEIEFATILNQLAVEVQAFRCVLDREVSPDRLRDLHFYGWLPLSDSSANPAIAAIMGIEEDMRSELPIELLGRPGCHLCDVAADILDQLAEDFPIRVVKVDISGNPDLLDRYRNDIPVGLAAGRELFRHHARPERLRPLLTRWLATGSLD